MGRKSENLSEIEREKVCIDRLELFFFAPASFLIAVGPLRSFE